MIQGMGKRNSNYFVIIRYPYYPWVDQCYENNYINLVITHSLLKMITCVWLLSPNYIMYNTKNVKLDYAEKAVDNIQHLFMLKTLNKLETEHLRVWGTAFMENIQLISYSTVKGWKFPPKIRNNERCLPLRLSINRVLEILPKAIRLKKRDK